jgi:hypothetical protein
MGNAGFQIFNCFKADLRHLYTLGGQTIFGAVNAYGFFKLSTGIMAVTGPKFLLGNAHGSDINKDGWLKEKAVCHVTFTKDVAAEDSRLHFCRFRHGWH